MKHFLKQCRIRSAGWNWKKKRELKDESRISFAGQDLKVNLRLSIKAIAVGFNEWNSSIPRLTLMCNKIKAPFFPQRWLFGFLDLQLTNSKRAVHEVAFITFLSSF